MPMICIQCSLRAFVQGEKSPIFEESREEHMRLFHPDPVATERERIELEEKLLKMIPPLGGNRRR